MAKLTAPSVAKAQPGEILRDAVVRGLHLRVFPNRKTYYLYYRTKDGIERRPKLGDHGILNIEEARKAARKLLAQVAQGEDPVAERRAARLAPTVGDLCDDYLAKHAANKKPRSRQEDTRIVDKYIRPRSLAAKRVSAVEYRDVAAVHESLKDTPYQANRVLAVLSKMFSLAEQWGLRPNNSNPCQHVHQYTERKRKRYMRYAEAPKIAELLRKYQASRPQSVLFIYLLILSGARPAEIAGARRDWIERRDIGGVLHLPDSKTGERSVYLSPAVMQMIDEAPATDGTLTGIQSPMATWKLVRKEAGCDDLRLYDLRHTFASMALKAGYSLSQIGELLGHSNEQTTKRYAHLIDESAQEAAAKTAGLLGQMLAGHVN